jgi:hypothetical protein
VEKALLPGMKHKIILCSDPASFDRMRFESFHLDDYVGIVDDDDVITENALSDCISAIEANNLDLVFTDENLLYENTATICPSRRGKRSYLGIASTPVEAHNLFVVRGASIDPKALDIVLRYGTGVEWVTKASVALTGKVGHIEKPHYLWTQRTSSYSKNYRDHFNKVHLQMRNDIKDTWPIPKGCIPVVG